MTTHHIQIFPQRVIRVVGGGGGARVVDGVEMGERLVWDVRSSDGDDVDLIVRTVVGSWTKAIEATFHHTTGSVAATRRAI